MNLMGLIDMPGGIPELPAGHRAVDLEIVPEAPGYYILDGLGLSGRMARRCETISSTRFLAGISHGIWS
jgi:hypothetical protein